MEGFTQTRSRVRRQLLPWLGRVFVGVALGMGMSPGRPPDGNIRKHLHRREYAKILL